MTRTHRTHYPLVILAVLAGALALAAPANAANNTFSGAVNSSWNTAGNWSDGIPTSDDVVFITSKFVTLAGAGATVSGLHITSGSDLTINATTLTINGPATLDHSFGLRINNDSTLNLNGPTTWMSGGISFEQSNGRLNIGNGGIFDVAADGLGMSTFSSLATTVLHVLPGGRLTRSAAGSAGAIAAIDNDGTVDATAGRLVLVSASGVHDGVYNPTSPATVAFTGGTYELSTTGRLTGTGTVAFADGTVVVPPLSAAFPSAYNPAHTRFEGGRLTLGSTGSTGDVVFTTSFPGRAGGAHLDVLGSTTMTVGGAFESGTTTLHGTTTIGLNNFPMRVNGNGTVNLAGAATVTSDGAFELSGNGTVNVAAGATLDIATSSFGAGSGGSGGAINVAAGGTLRRTTGTDGVLGVPLVNEGTVSLDAGRLTLTNTTLTQTAGVLDVRAGAQLRLQATPSHAVNLAGGTLRGTGTIRGESIDPGKATVSNTGGTVAPGASPGILTIEGDYTQGAAGTLQAEIAGVTAGSGYDRLVVAGTATLDGTLAIVNDPSFAPAAGNTFDILTATGTVSGTFATLSGAQVPSGTYSAQYTAGPPGKVTLALTPAPLNSVAPSISGNPQPGSTLSCDPGTWSGSPTFAFQWLRDGVPIAGATASSYAVAAGDVGATLVCRVTATDSGGSTSADSSGVAVTAVASPPAASPSPPSPPPPPPPAEATIRGVEAFTAGDSNDLYLACTKRDVLLIDVLRSGARKVSVTGTADLRLAGRSAEIRLDGKLVGRAAIRPDGNFAAKVAAPPFLQRASARYEARVGDVKSQQLKLERRMVATTLTRSGSVLVLRGQVTKPFARKPAAIEVQRFLTCRRTEKVKVARVVPDRKGKFAVKIPVPAGAKAAIYRAFTKVARGKGAPPTARTFTLPRAIDLP